VRGDNERAVGAVVSQHRILKARRSLLRGLPPGVRPPHARENADCARAPRQPTPANSKTERRGLTCRRTSLLVAEKLGISDGGVRRRRHALAVVVRDGRAGVLTEDREAVWRRQREVDEVSRSMVFCAGWTRRGTSTTSSTTGTAIGRRPVFRGLTGSS
jgi:hypothetical protein